MTAQEILKTERRGTFAPARIALASLFVAYLALVIGFAWDPTPLAQALAAIGIVVAVVHATLFYGARDALAIFAICITITFAMENLALQLLFAVSSESMGDHDSGSDDWWCVG